MCGILPLLSPQSNLSILHSIQLLKRLEYRGYDSAGIMYLDHSTVLEQIEIRYSYIKKGKINCLESNLSKFRKWIYGNWTEY